MNYSQTDVNEIETIKKLNSKKKTIILAHLANMVLKESKKGIFCFGIRL
jgi:hypothetical protein